MGGLIDEAEMDDATRGRLESLLRAAEETALAGSKTQQTGTIVTVWLGVNGNSCCGGDWYAGTGGQGREGDK